MSATDRCPVCGRKLRWCNCGYIVSLVRLRTGKRVT